jgi:AAA15 family ATPase/GTPase
MLIEFSVKNFKSFRDLNKLDLRASSGLSDSKDNVISVNEDLNLLKSVVIYGANESGKSNLLEAIDAMRMMVRTSISHTPGQNLPAFPFKLDGLSSKKDSFFEVVCIVEEKIYRYGFEVNKLSFTREWLYEATKTKERNLFKREGGIIKFSKKYFPDGKGLDTNTQDNALFLSVTARLSKEFASISLFNWFLNINSISGLFDQRYKTYAIQSMETDSELSSQVVNITKKLGAQIENLSVESNQDHKEIYTTHKTLSDLSENTDVKFNLESEESEGTKKLIYLLAPLIDTLKNNKLLTIDEIDAKLHPLLTRQIIRMVNSPENNKAAQFIMTTHDASLFDLLRRDQIWFTEKDPSGSSTLYSLTEFRNVRKSSKFGKDYIMGRYGAIPYLGNIDKLLE